MLLEDLSELVSKIRESKYDGSHAEEFLKVFSEALLCDGTFFLGFTGGKYLSGKYQSEKQYIISFNITRPSDNNLDFGFIFSYQEDFFKICTTRHNGYWSREHLSYKFSEHKQFAQTLKSVLLKELGLE